MIIILICIFVVLITYLIVKNIIGSASDVCGSCGNFERCFATRDNIYGDRNCFEHPINGCKDFDSKY